jgi:hypothetical protein
VPNVNYTVVDTNGKGIPGAIITQKTAGGWCSASTNTGTTNSQGLAAIDDNCVFNATVSWSVQASGYAADSGTFNVSAIGLNIVPVITLSQSSGGCLGGICPPGYTCINGECVASAVNWNDAIAPYLPDIVLAAVAIPFFILTMNGKAPWWAVLLAIAGTLFIEDFSIGLPFGLGVIKL